jgi:hypothetical protein
MKNKVFYVVALTVGMVFVMSGCKDCDDPSDPDCGNYDPCFGQEEFKPNFEIITGISHVNGKDFLPRPIWDGEYKYLTFVGDTMINGNAYFKADRAYDSVKWKIGYESEFRSGKDLALRFEEPVTQLPITMIGKRTPNKKCFPNEQAIDTVQRFLTTWPPDSIRYIGKWYGSFSDYPNDSFEINIGFGIRIPDFPRDTYTNDNQYYYGTLTHFYAVGRFGHHTWPDDKDRTFRLISINGRVFGKNYEHLVIYGSCYYTSDKSKTYFDVTFNARRK